MQKDRKLLILVILLLIIICIICAIVFGKKKPEQQIKTPQNTMLEVKNTENYKILNGNIATKSEITTFSADIKNVSGKQLPANKLKVEFLNKFGEKLGEVEVYVEKLEAGEITQITARMWDAPQDTANYIITEQ